MTETTKPDTTFYRAAFNRLGMLGIQNVLDLGCGDGNFVEVMTAMGQNPKVYQGIDFSLEKIEAARKRFPEWNFRYADFFSDQVRIEMEKFGACLLLNVLEYIDRDVELLQGLPSGKPVVFSVQAFESEGALRHFPKDLDVRDRYSSPVKIESIGRHTDKSGRRWRMVTATRW